LLQGLVHVYGKRLERPGSLDV